MSKRLFISAYIWSYGVSKNHAANVYKKASKEYIKAIIDGYLNQCQKLFYND